MALYGELGNGGGGSLFESGRGNISTLNESPQGIVLQENHCFRESLSIRIVDYRAKFNLEVLRSHPRVMDEIK